ncbi:MAG: hypothetical protein L0G46_09070 [Kocuria sp.]|nr:hypothetical protein [Kocuria sp.]
MVRAQAERTWDEFMRTGRAVIRTSPTKAVLATVGLGLLGILAGGMAYSDFVKNGVASFQFWGCCLVAALLVVGMIATIHPLVRQRRLVLEGPGFFVESRRHGAWHDELRVRWDNVWSVAAHSSSNGESTTTRARVTLRPGTHPEVGATAEQGYVDMPTGLGISVRQLAEVMARIAARSTDRDRT